MTQEARRPATLHCAPRALPIGTVTKAKSYLCSEDLRAPDLDRYLRQGLGRRAVHDRPAVRRVEDRAVAGAGEVAVVVAHGALTVRADRRVRREVAALKVYQDRLLRGLFVGKLDCRALRHIGLLGDGRPSLDLGDPAVRCAGLSRLRCPLNGPLSGCGASLFGFLAPTAAGRGQRSAGSYPQGRPEPDEPPAREPFLGQDILLRDLRGSFSRRRVYTRDHRLGSSGLCRVRRIGRFRTLGEEADRSRLAERRDREAPKPRFPPTVRRQPQRWRVRLAGTTVVSELYAEYRGAQRRALRAGPALRRAGVGTGADPRPPHQPGGPREHRPEPNDTPLTGRGPARHGHWIARDPHHKLARSPDLAPDPLEPRGEGALLGRTPRERPTAPRSPPHQPPHPRRPPEPGVKNHNDRFRFTRTPVRARL